MNRIRAWLREVWYHRPVLTTFARYDGRDENGYTRGLAEAAEHAATIYRLGYDAGVNNATGTWPDPPRPSGHTTRTTPTGRTLVAVGP